MRSHLGSIREVLKSDGAHAARYDYGPYGKRITQYQASTYGGGGCEFGFTGHLTVPSPVTGQTEMVLTHFRAYDPELNRWLSADPLGEEGGMNPYAYVYGDTLNRWDPLGLDAQCVLNRDPSKKGENPRLSAGTMTITENGKHVASVRVNENGFHRNRQGIPRGTYNILPKAENGEIYPKGTPAVTSPGMKPGATKAGHPEGSVLVHGAGPPGQPDSRACLTLSPKDLKTFTDVFNRNQNSTTLTVNNGQMISPNQK